MEGEKVEYTYKFTNAGTGDLVVTNAKAGCGCTVPDWTKTPIKPGKEGEIKVVFDSEGREGFHTRTIPKNDAAPPAATDTALPAPGAPPHASPATLVGRWQLFACPSPRFPCSFQPHVSTQPQAATQRTCSAPQVIAAGDGSAPPQHPSTCGSRTGAGRQLGLSAGPARSGVLPSPTPFMCPSSLSGGCSSLSLPSCPKSARPHVRTASCCSGDAAACGIVPLAAVGDATRSGPRASAAMCDQPLYKPTARKGMSGPRPATNPGGETLRRPAAAPYSGSTPHCPWRFEPHATTAPSLHKAALCCHPHATPTKSRRGA